jgi:hypothetical protein
MLRGEKLMLKEAYIVKVYNNKNGGVDKYHFKEYKQAQAKARKLRKNPNFGVSIYKVSKEW